MSRKERRYQHKAARATPIRKSVKADKKVLIILAVITVLIVVISYYLRYNGAI